jgi:hypothetical protein
MRKLMLVGVALPGRRPQVVDLEAYRREHEAETRALVEAGLLRPEWGEPEPPAAA